MKDDQIRDVLPNGDKQSRKESVKWMYDSYYGIVAKLIRELGGVDEDAKDVFQEAMMILYQNILSQKFKGDSSLKTYFISICKNIWFGMYKKRVKDDKIAKELQTNPDDRKPMRYDFKALSDIINTLSDDCARILVYYYYENSSMDQLKETFGLGSVQAAKNKKYRCLKYLARKISEMGLNYQTFIL